MSGVKQRPRDVLGLTELDRKNDGLFYPTYCTEVSGRMERELREWADKTLHEMEEGQFYSSFEYALEIRGVVSLLWEVDQSRQRLLRERVELALKWKELELEPGKEKPIEQARMIPFVIVKRVDGLTEEVEELGKRLRRAVLFFERQERKRLRRLERLEEMMEVACGKDTEGPDEGDGPE